MEGTGVEGSGMEGSGMEGSGLIVRARGEGEKRWFYGGGLHTWKATAEETNGAFLFFEDHLAQGKMTPVHIHPDADEVFYVLEGEIIVHVEGGEEHRIREGDFALALRGLPHAFMATTETRLLCMHTPGTAQAFFRHASEPSTDDRIDGPMDFARVQAAANDQGGVKLLGPPPSPPLTPESRGMTLVYGPHGAGPRRARSPSAMWRRASVMLD